MSEDGKKSAQKKSPSKEKQVKNTPQKKQIDEGKKSVQKKGGETSGKNSVVKSEGKQSVQKKKETEEKKTDNKEEEAEKNKKVAKKVAEKEAEKKKQQEEKNGISEKSVEKEDKNKKSVVNGKKEDKKDEKKEASKKDDKKEASKKDDKKEVKKDDKKEVKKEDKKDDKKDNKKDDKKEVKKEDKKEVKKDDKKEDKNGSKKKTDDKKSKDAIEEEEEKSKKSKKSGLAASSLKQKAKEQLKEEVVRPTRSGKRVMLDNRDFYKSELKKDKEWPTSENLQKQIDEFLSKVKEEKLNKDLLTKLYSTIDLTSLNSTDGYDFIEDWLEKNLVQVEKDHKLKPAAICVFPIFGKLVRKKIKSLKTVKTAVVSTCFPTGQTFLEVKLQETKIAAREGAEEVDMVVSRGLWNEGSYEDVLEEIYETKKACNNAHLKVILENCDLKGLESIYKLSFLSLCAGGDFIKTSTGKGKWGAKPEEFAAMCIALKDFNEIRKDQFEVRGIKAAGGVGDSKTAHKFYQLFELITGKKPTPENFRIGASSLAKAIIKDIQDL